MLVKLSVNLFSANFSIFRQKKCSQNPSNLHNSFHISSTRLYLIFMFSCLITLCCNHPWILRVSFGRWPNRLQTCLTFYNRFNLNNLNGSTREDGGGGQRSSPIHFRSDDFRPRESEIINYGGNGARLNFTKIRLDSYDQFSPPLSADFNRQEEETEVEWLDEIDELWKNFPFQKKIIVAFSKIVSMNY